MNAHINNVQIIKQNGLPAFAVIPYNEYLALLPANQENYVVPTEVAERVILKNMPLIKAWRLHLGLTQKEVAQQAGISQAALSQMEHTENKSRSATLAKLANSMKLSIEQLRD